VKHVAIQRQDGAIFCERCTVAETMLRRMRGLLGRKGLEPSEGLLLRPAPAIQTWFLRFPIDAVFLDRDLTVVLIHERLHPFRAASHRRARSVLELAAGECERQKLAVGERLRIVWPDEELARRNEALDHRLRVAMATTDARFLRVATFLLERHGFGVDGRRTADEVLDLVARHAADVALIDGTGSLQAAARVSRAIEGIDPTVGVVVVAERNGVEPPANLPVIEKWSSFDAIIERIEAASTAAGRAA
jgi:uncharacterized membrane protein (UPF0127 family)